MKKLILFVIFGIIVNFSITSCITSSYGQDVAVEVENGADVNVIVRYGTPYYFEGSLLYYLYDGWYYYPYRYNNMWYYYRYSKPFPIYRGYRFSPHPNHRPYHIDRGYMRHRHDSYKGFGSNRMRPQSGRSSTYNRHTSRPNFENRRNNHGWHNQPRQHNNHGGRGFGGRR